MIEGLYSFLENLVLWVLEAEGRAWVLVTIAWLSTASLAVGFGFRRAALCFLVLPPSVILIGGLFLFGSAALFGPSRGGMSSMADGLLATMIMVATGAVAAVLFIAGAIYGVVRRKWMFERRPKFIPLLLLSCAGFAYLGWSAAAIQREAHPGVARLVDKLLDPDFSRWRDSDVLNALRRESPPEVVDELMLRLGDVAPNEFRVRHYSAAGLERAFIILGKWCEPECIPEIERWADYERGGIVQKAAQDALVLVEGRSGVEPIPD